jgi:hypothetical protein
MASSRPQNRKPIGPVPGAFPNSSLTGVRGRLLPRSGHFACHAGRAYRVGCLSGRPIAMPAMRQSAKYRRSLRALIATNFCRHYPAAGRLCAKKKRPRHFSRPSPEVDVRHSKARMRHSSPLPAAAFSAHRRSPILGLTAQPTRFPAVSPALDGKKEKTLQTTSDQFQLVPLDLNRQRALDRFN